MYVEGSCLLFAKIGRDNAVHCPVRSYAIGKEKALSRSRGGCETEPSVVARWICGGLISQPETSSRLPRKGLPGWLSTQPNQP